MTIADSRITAPTAVKAVGPGHGRGPLPGPCEQKRACSPATRPSSSKTRWSGSSARHGVGLQARGDNLCGAAQASVLARQVTVARNRPRRRPDRARKPGAASRARPRRSTSASRSSAISRPRSAPKAPRGSVGDRPGRCLGLRSGAPRRGAGRRRRDPRADPPEHRCRPALRQRAARANSRWAPGRRRSIPPTRRLWKRVSRRPTSRATRGCSTGTATGTAARDMGAFEAPACCPTRPLPTP